MKVLVTGASGFVGSRICSDLEADGHDVVRVVHKNSDQSNVYTVDVGEAETFATLEGISNIDAIIHCAGIAHRFGRTSKHEYFRVNVRGTRNVAEFAARKCVRTFIHFSTVLVYGPAAGDGLIDESTEPAPVDDYSSSKYEGEKAALDVCKNAGIEIVVLRPVPIIGEGSRGNVSRLIEAIDRNRFFWIGDGRNERSFIYVGDIAQAGIAALSIGSDAAIFNLSGGVISVRELVATIHHRLGVAVPNSYVSNAVARFANYLVKPLAKLPIVGRYQRTLDTWLATAVYSGVAFDQYRKVPMTNVREAIQREVDFYLATKN